MMLAILAATGLLVSAPANTPEIVVEVNSVAVVLFESPEMLALAQRAIAAKNTLARRDILKAENREAYDAAHSDYSTIGSGIPGYVLTTPADLAERISELAVTATLTEGTRLTVLDAQERMLEVRVETGRARGAVGWVKAEDVKPKD